MTSTSRASRVGLGFAHLLSTLIVCGGLALLASPPPSSESVFNAAVFAWNMPADPSSGREWVSGRLETDPPDSDDDNDDDDAPDGSDSVVPADPDVIITDVRTHPPLDLQFTPPCATVARDAHSLRAPPQ